MKNIDTLFLSGGGINSLAIVGVFQYLFDNNIITPDLSGIKNIICVSGSSFIILPFLLKLSIHSIIKIFLTYNEKIINFKEFHINNLFTHYGLYDLDFLDNLIIPLLINRGFSKNMTLLELYNLTSINLVIKVVNINQKTIKYINHVSDPDIPIIQAIKMTCCIPFVFKPIQYRGDLYNDGGISGNFPIEYNQRIKSKKYLGIRIKSKENRSNINTIMDYLKSLNALPFSPYDLKKSKKIINIDFSLSSFSFNATQDEKLKRIQIGFQETVKHFNNLRCIHLIPHVNEDQINGHL
tara:strand:+ start:1836 stop:2720 length:885 start_codon:yes stop_codon:yes gene_type:complete